MQNDNKNTDNDKILNFIQNWKLENNVNDNLKFVADFKKHLETEKYHPRTKQIWFNILPSI